MTEVLRDAMGSPRVDERILPAVDDEGRALHSAGELPGPLRSAVDIRSKEASKRAQECIGRVGQVIARLRLREGLRGSLLGHPLGVAEAHIDGAAHPLFGRHGQVLLDEPLPHTRHRDDRQVRIRLRCIDGRERGRDEREAAGKIGTPRGQLERDSSTE